jgi:hypothetical protein
MKIKKMKIKKYEDFINEEINLKKALVGGAIGAASFLSPYDASASEPIKPDTVTLSQQQNKTPIEEFVREIEIEKPALFTSEEIMQNSQIEFGKFERVSFLEQKAMEHENRTGTKLDLDILSSPRSSVPFRINYFYVRGLDNVEAGPFMIRIINVDFTKALEIGGHKVFFNFTRTDVNSFGARIEL